jgi:hypothetical protein
MMYRIVSVMVTCIPLLSGEVEKGLNKILYDFRICCLRAKRRTFGGKRKDWLSS